MWNPCLECGACCAYFRASFHWSEADPATGGLTPPELTRQLTPHHAVLLGTDRSPPRCIALSGTIGKSVFCTIHPLRPSPCRDFPASWTDGRRNERCDRARAAHGLPPLAAPHEQAPLAPAAAPTLLPLPAASPALAAAPALVLAADAAPSLSPALGLPLDAGTPLLAL